ncbi:MAG: hypothetical protein AAAFM81_00215 [Pseudomonadota bacterium]
MKKFTSNVLPALWFLVITGCSSAIYPDPRTAAFPARAFQEVAISDPALRLDEQEKATLACFVVTTEAESQRRYHQSYPVSITTPIVALIRTNFSEFESMSWLGKASDNGGFVLLSQLSELVASHCRSK